jgi:hypothetical protein
MRIFGTNFTKIVSLNIIVLLGMASASHSSVTYSCCFGRVFATYVGWLQFLVLECLLHSPRASSILALSMESLLCYAEKF